MRVPEKLVKSLLTAMGVEAEDWAAALTEDLACTPEVEFMAATAEMTLEDGVKVKAMQMSSVVRLYRSA